jgi:hypothetical protein
VATGLTPDAWQARLLRSNAPRILLNCCRQSGKSTATASLALHTALYAAPALILALSPSLHQSQEIFRKVMAQYRALGRPVAAVSETTTHLELSSGSRIVCLPENEETIRGFSGVTLLIIDEASRVADDVYSAVLPMLGASYGRLVALATPWGKMGWWFEAWTHGGARYERYEVPITTPEIARRIDPSVVADARARGGWWYDQEYLCQFGEREDAVFSAEHILRAIRSDLAPIDDVIPIGVS